MVAAQVIGYDTAITVAGQAGNFQLNVMLPVIATTSWRAYGCWPMRSSALADRAIAGFTVNRERLAERSNATPFS